MKLRKENRPLCRNSTINRSNRLPDEPKTGSEGGPDVRERNRVSRSRAAHIPSRPMFTDAGINAGRLAQCDVGQIILRAFFHQHNLLRIRREVKNGLR